MKATALLKKGRVAKQLMLQGRKTIEVTVYRDGQTAELPYSIRRNNLKDKGYVKFSPILMPTRQPIVKPQPKEVKVLGRRLPLK